MNRLKFVILFFFIIFLKGNIFCQDYDKVFLDGNHENKIIIENYNKDLIKNNNVCSIKEYMFRPDSKRDFSKKLINEYHFDRSGNIIERIDISSTTPKKIYSYDAFQRLTEKVYYDKNGKINEDHKWSYDSLGRIKTYVTFFEWSKKEYIDNYVYNDNNLSSI